MRNGRSGMGLFETARARRKICPKCSSNVVTTPNKDVIKCVSDGCGWKGSVTVGGSSKKKSQKKRGRKIKPPAVLGLQAAIAYRPLSDRKREHASQKAKRKP